LQAVKDGNGKLVARYGYDPLDRRIWREQFRERDGTVLAPATRTIYLYADEGLVAEASQDIVLNDNQSVTANASPVITTQYGLQPDSQFTTGVMFVKTKASDGKTIFAYFHHDQRGSPIQATDKAGNIVWAANYSPFGQATITTPAAIDSIPTIVSSLRLPGQVEDPETGLHYNFRRYYDPTTGRYITQDPIGIDGGNNKYRYADADPINVADSSGECPMCAAYAVCVAQCVAEDYGYNAAFGQCNNFGESAKECAMSCVLGPLGRMGKWAKRAGAKRPKVPDGPCSINSFPGDAKVHVKPRSAADGNAQDALSELVKISEIKVGDEVLAFSEWKAKGDVTGKDGRLSYEKVTDVYVSQKVQQLIHLTLSDGSTITATDGHPFMTADGWRDAVLLRPGNELRLKGGVEGLQTRERKVLIENINIEEKIELVFNLEVANAHTYFVGEDGVLVHNGGCIYEVPGSRTPSGKPYVGQTGKDSPDLRPGNGKDGRNREAGDKTQDLPDDDGALERRIEEQKAINGRGGLDNLDNKINSVKEEDWGKYGIPPVKK
jgi:RHS repeat-associated protein